MSGWLRSADSGVVVRAVTIGTGCGPGGDRTEPNEGSSDPVSSVLALSTGRDHNETVPVSPELSEIICAAASLLPRTRRAIETSRLNRSPTGLLARELGDLVRAYDDLSERLRSLPPTELGARVDRLLACQMEIAAQASSLAFRVHNADWPALAARFGDGQGPVADELLSLAAAVSSSSVNA